MRENIDIDSHERPWRFLRSLPVESFNFVSFPDEQDPLNEFLDDAGVDGLSTSELHMLILAYLEGSGRRHAAFAFSREARTGGRIPYDPMGLPLLVNRGLILDLVDLHAGRDYNGLEDELLDAESSASLFLRRECPIRPQVFRLHPGVAVFLRVFEDPVTAVALGDRIAAVAGGGQITFLHLRPAIRVVGSVPCEFDPAVVLSMVWSRSRLFVGGQKELCVIAQWEEVMRRPLDSPAISMAATDAMICVGCANGTIVFFDSNLSVVRIWDLDQRLSRCFVQDSGEFRIVTSGGSWESDAEGDACRVAAGEDPWAALRVRCRKWRVDVSRGVVRVRCPPPDNIRWEMQFSYGVASAAVSDDDLLLGTSHGLVVALDATRLVPVT